MVGEAYVGATRNITARDQGDRKPEPIGHAPYRYQIDIPTQDFLKEDNLPQSVISQTRSSLFWWRRLWDGFMKRNSSLYSGRHDVNE